jgi:hypothetical protein
MKALVGAQREFLFETPKPRFFVYQYCLLLEQQKDRQREMSAAEAVDFVNNNEPPLAGDEE